MPAIHVCASPRYHMHQTVTISWPIHQCYPCNWNCPNGTGLPAPPSRRCEAKQVWSKSVWACSVPCTYYTKTKNILLSCTAPVKVLHSSCSKSVTYLLLTSSSCIREISLTWGIASLIPRPFPQGRKGLVKVGRKFGHNGM